jgi:hypothetical protein
VDNAMQPLLGQIKNQKKRSCVPSGNSLSHKFFVSPPTGLTFNSANPGLARLGSIIPPLQGWHLYDIKISPNSLLIRSPKSAIFWQRLRAMCDQTLFEK